MHVFLFLSHSSRDRQIAEAFKELLEDVFGKTRVVVEFSSDQGAEGGVPPGAHWLPWITERIRRADKTYVLLTPNSMRGTSWILWESGAAAGVALATDRESQVVPVTFGIGDSDIPTPLAAAQRVRGDSETGDGIIRILQDLNVTLGDPFGGQVFTSIVGDSLPGFFVKVRTALERSSPIENLLAILPSSFSAVTLGGHWLTYYKFRPTYSLRRHLRYHVDISYVVPESDRKVIIKNYPPDPRAEGDVTPFRNMIEAELVGRHLIGHWRNVNDTRYFGSMHLAVLPAESVMEGYYTGFDSDVLVSAGRWRWVRLDPVSVAGVDLTRVVLRAPKALQALAEQHSAHAPLLALSAIAEDT